MKMKSHSININTKFIENILIRENKFLNDLFSVVPVPVHETEEVEADEEETDGLVKTQEQPKPKATTRAKSITELQERLQAIQSKKKLTYKEKLVKKGLKNRMKKKSKQDERNAKQKLVRAEKQFKKEQKQKEELPDDDGKNQQPTKPVFNKDSKMVFSKFDFSNIGKKTNKKEEKDPKKLLTKLKEQKEKLAELEKSGEKEKAVEIKEKIHWKNALAKAEGKKVKDDPNLLKKTIRKQKERVNASKKIWEARHEGVKKAQEERQKKRTENIEKRKKDKKMKKLKSAAKKGRIIPGF